MSANYRKPSRGLIGLTGHPSYQLQVQVNTLNVGISRNWFPIAGSDYTNRWSVPIDRTAPPVFDQLSNQ